MPLKKRDCYTHYPPTGLISVSLAGLLKVQNKAWKLLQHGRRYDDPLWEYGREIQTLGHDVRWGQYRHYETLIGHYFRPKTAKEEDIVRHLWHLATCFDGNVWVTEYPSEQFHKRLEDAYRSIIVHKDWIDEWLGPERTLVFIEMCKRKFGTKTIDRMWAAYEERCERRKAAKAKREEKAKRAAATVGELKRFPCFTPEGGIVGNN